MDDKAKLKITRSQLLDDARKLSRVQMVSDRIYRNHLKTRFDNLQEQQKLTNTIDELEKQEKDSWRELNHRMLGLERRASKLAKKKAITSVAASPLVTLRTAGRSRPARFDNQDSLPAPRNRGRREGRAQLAAPKIWGQERRPSFSSLLNPYMTDPSEYGTKLGYAQHLTTKGNRKYSSLNSPLELEDLQQYNYNQPQFSKSQAVIFRGLKQSAQGLIKMGVIQPDPRNNRRVGGHHIPATLEEDKARYIRTPGKQEHDIIEEELPWLPKVTYQDSYHGNSYHGERRRSSLKSAPDTNLLRVGGANRNAYRRGSRSLGELEMRKYLPYAGRCPSPVSGLDNDFSDKLSLFHQRMDQLQHRDSLEKLPEALTDEHTAPPPRDPLDIGKQVGTLHPDSEEGPVILAGRDVRMSVVDRFEMSKWRRNMAEQDTLPVIKACKYIRNPSRERYDPQSNQYYVIEGEEEVEVDEPAPLPSIPGTRLYTVVKEAVRYSREFREM